MASEKVTKFLDEIATWTLLEVKEFVNAFEEKFDVKAQAAVAVAAGPAGGGGAAEAAPAKTEFDVELTSFGDNKIGVIKAVREVTSLGLAEAKKLVESAPAKVKEKVSKEEAETVAKKLSEAGAKAVVK